VVGHVVAVGEVIGAGEDVTRVRGGVVALPAALVAVTVKVDVPVVVGVPESTPVVGSNSRPTGSDPLLTAYVGAGYPAAVNV